MEEVQNFMDSLGDGAVGRCRGYLDLLKNYGYNIRMPYSKNVLPGIFELRVGGVYNVRLIYTFSQGCAIIFYGFMKKTEKIKRRELKIIKIKFNNLQI